MKHIHLYFNENEQKVGRRKQIITGAKDGFEYVGTLTEVERELLIEILFMVYGDDHISLDNFLRIFGDLKTFCDKIKQIV